LVIEPATPAGSIHKLGIAISYSNLSALSNFQYRFFSVQNDGFCDEIATEINLEKQLTFSL
jgi:hypothetical protein